MAVATGLAVGLAVAAGYALRALAPAPPTSGEFARMASELLVAHPTDLKPEPAEHFIYAGLIAMSPLLAGAAAWAAVRWRRAGEGRADGVLLAISLLAAGAVLAFDPVSVRFQLAPWAFALACVVAAAAAAGDLAVEGRRWAGPVVAIAAGGVAMGLVFVNDVRDVHTLHAPRMHFEAFAYSVVAAARGRVCMVTVRGQYGCYGTVLGPILRAVGTTVGHITLTAVALSAAAIAAIALFAARTMRSPVLIAGAVLALAATNLRPGGDVYFQYLPLRVLFPALSLVAILWWERGPSFWRAATLGTAAALAVFWNLDAGAPTGGAVGLYLVAAGATGAGGVRRRLALGATYAASAAAAGGVLIALLATMGGAWPDLRTALDYQRIFVNSGFYMLPMPSPPAAWAVLAAVAGVALVWFALRAVERRPSRTADRAAFLAVLATGLFSYYVGRSHPLVLIAAAWPFLILAFVLLDALRPSSRTAAAALRWAGALAVVVLVVMAGEAWPRLRPSPPFGVDQTAEDIAFVRSRTAPGAPLAILATKQAVILGELERAPALPGPGWAETLTRHDADALFDFLAAHGPRDLFIGSVFLRRDRSVTDLSPWVAERMPRLVSVYALAERGPGGRLLRFVRRPLLPPIPMAAPARSR